MNSEELGKSPVIRMAGSDGHTYETTADDAHNMALAARDEGVQLKAFIKTKDAEGNIHEISPFDGAALKDAEDRGDTRYVESAEEPDYFSAEALKAGAARFAIGVVNPWDWLRGIGTAAGTVFRGFAKGVVGTGIKALQGGAYLGESLTNMFTDDDNHELSNFIGKVNEGFEKTVDFLTPDLFEKTGEYDGVEGAKEATGAVKSVAEMVANVKGIGTLTKVMRASGATAKAAHAATGALFGAGKYGEVASDENGPGGAEQQVAALVAGAADAVIFGLWNPFKIGEKYLKTMKPFMQATRLEAAKRFVAQATNSGLSMAAVEAVKQGAEVTAGGLAVGTSSENRSEWSERTMGEVVKSIGAQFLVGSAFVAIDPLEQIPGRIRYRSARKSQGDVEEGWNDNMRVAMSYQVERNRKDICPKYHAQAVYAYNRFVKQGGRAEGFKEGLSQAPDVRRVNEDGSVVFDDGSVWRPDPRMREGNAYTGATITVSDGTVLSERGELLGYRPRREATQTDRVVITNDRTKPDESGSRERVSIEKPESNAMLVLQQIDDGKLPVADIAIGDIEAINPTENGSEITEWDAAKAKPIIVFEDLEGGLHAATGGKRLAMATASGEESIKAVIVREADGWTRQDASRLNDIENLRDGHATMKNVVEAVESLGIDQVAEMAGWHQKMGSGEFASKLRRGIAVAQKATPELKDALIAGRISEEFAYNAAQTLSMERVGEGWETAQKTVAELIGKVGPEELDAVVWGLRERGGKEQITDWEAAIAEERAKYNAKKGGKDGQIDSDAVLIETAEGELKTLGEMEADLNKPRAGEAQGGADGAQTLYQAAEGAAINKAAELRPVEGEAGAFTSLSHPEARFTIDGSTHTIAVDGISVMDFEPSRIEQTAALVAKVEAHAATHGLKIGFYDDTTRALWETVKKNIRQEGHEAYSAKRMEAKRQTLVDHLSKSGLAAEVVGNTDSFNKMLVESGGEPLKKGEEIYGFVDPKTKKVYLNPEFFGTGQAMEAPLHEFGHLGIIACEKTNKAVYDKGMKLAAGFLENPETAGDGAIREIVDLIVNDRVYSGQNRATQAQELLAQLIGKRGAEALRAETDKSVIAKVKSWLVEFWNGFGKALGLKDITPEEAERMTLEDVADAIRAEMLGGGKYGEGFKAVEFAEGGARTATKPERVKRRLTGRQKAVNEFVSMMGGGDDPTNTDTDLLALWVDNGGRLFDKMPFEVSSGYSKGKTGVKKTRSAVADEFAESTAFYKDLDAAQRKVFFGTEKLENGPIGEGLKQKLEAAGITRFTREDGTIDYEGVIEEFKRQWTDYERGGEILKERSDYDEARAKAYVEEMERVEAAEREAMDQISAEEAAARDEAAKSGMMFSRSGIFTGSGADYEKPSLQKVGTGEGNQVYGWGLYGSTERGVGEEYARRGASYENTLAANALSWANGDKTKAIKWIRTVSKPTQWTEKAIKLIRSGKKPNVGNLYEQTWFTNREPGDESHLLKWYEPVSKETWDIIREGVKAIGDTYEESHIDRRDNSKHSELFWKQGHLLERNGKPVYPGSTTGQSFYKDLAIVLGSPKAASEYLAKIGIDGVKYPVDSYGKTVKDGDKAGWNYVSFRDDNIRVDHKWRDGQLLFSRATLKNGRDYVHVDVEQKQFDAKTPSEQQRIAKRVILKKFKGKVIGEDGARAFVPKDSAGEYAYPAKRIEGYVHEAKMRTSPELDTLLSTAQFKGHNADDGRHPNAKGGWDHYDAIFEVGGKYFRGDIALLVDAKGRRRFHDVTQIKEETLSQLLKSTQGRSASSGYSAHKVLQGRNPGEGSSAADIITNPSERAQGGNNLLLSKGRANVVTPEEDAAYVDAVKRGDKATYQKMLREVSARRGYATPHYFDQHSAPSPAYVQGGKENFRNLDELRRVHEEDGGDLNLFAIANGISSVPGDYFTRKGLKYYMQEAYGKAAYESLDALQPAIEEIRRQMSQYGEVKNMPRVKVYRAVPKSVKEGSLQSEGQWVSPSKAYAVNHGEHRFGKGKYRIIEQLVGADELWFDGNAITEWGFDDGTENVYKNTKNNRKLLEPTYDNDGNLIPLSERFNDRQNDIRFSRGTAPSSANAAEGRPEAEYVRLTRVADDAGAGERTPGAMAASAELSRTTPTPLTTKGTRYVALPVSEMAALARYLKIGHAQLLRQDMPGGVSLKHKKLWIAADVLGTVDKTDMAAEKEILRQHGFFQQEDPGWLATHSPTEARRERFRSEDALAAKLEALADRRIAGKEPGGFAAGRKVFADQLAKVVMSMPHGQPGVLGAMQTVGGALEKRVRGDEAEAEAFIGWMKGETTPPARSAQERKAEMFAAFLMMPQEMQARAPRWYDAMRSTIAGDAKLADAFRKMTARSMSEQAHAHLEAEISRTIDEQYELNVKKLRAEAEEPIKAGGAGDVAKEKIILAADDRMGAAIVRVDARTRLYEQAQKAAMAAAQTPEEKARIKQATDVFMGKIAQAKNQVELSRTAWERGRNNADMRYHYRMVDLLNEATVRDGLRLNDLSLYLDQKRVIETRGLSGSRGQSARQAQLVLDAMKARLGTDFAKIEAFARKFHAIHEQELLDNPLLEKVLGKGTAEYWRSQASYVTTKRTFSPEELAEIEAARRTLAASGAAGGDTVVGQMFNYCGRPKATSKLKGSFADKQEVMSATFEKVAEVQKFLRRSDYVISLRDMLQLANVEGVHDFASGKSDFARNARYGAISYMENGQKRTLVVPREIADGFERQATYDAGAIKLCASVNNLARQLWIDWNPVYWQRNIARNIGSMEMNMPGMRESIVKRGARFVMPGLAPVTEIAMTHLVRHMPEKMSLPLRKIWGEHTALYYAPKAKRMALWLTDHNEMQKKLWAAEKRGDLGAVQEMLQDQRDMLDALKGNMLVGLSAGKASGTSGFLDDSVRGLGKTMQRELADFESRPKLRKALDAATWIFRKNSEQQVFEDVMAKFSAYLHDRAQFGSGNNRTLEESGLVVKKNVSIGEGERKGKNAGTVQALFQPFWNMVEKGVTRSVKAYGDRPGETFQKAAWRIGPMLLQGLIGSGAVAAWILKAHDGDEAAAESGSMGDVYRYARNAQRAYQNCSNYVKENYHVTPLWTDGWTSVVIGMPLTDEERLLKPIARFVTDAADVASGVKERMDLAGFMSDATGVIAPDFKMAGALPTLLDDTVHALWENPEDYYTGGTKYDSALWTARNESWEMRGKFAAAVGRRLWNDFGGRNVLPVERGGVDNGLGKAPGWVAKAVNEIPIASPILRSFVKVQVGSPKKDAAEILDTEKRRNAVIGVLAKELFETARKEGQDISLDAARYVGKLEAWEKRYGFTPNELAKIEAKYLNAWREYDAAQWRADGEREKYRAKAEQLGLDAASIWLDFD